MWTNLTGRVFWSLLVLFPVTELSSRCVTYQHRNICSLKGSSVDLLCTYPKNAQVISISGWSKKSHPNKRATPVKQISSYSSRMQYNESGNNDCTLKLADLKKRDTSNYYFIYTIREVKGNMSTCICNPRVSLQVFDSAVRILMEPHVRSVFEGQRVNLTCVPNCDLSSNPGYIWYKNRKQFNDSGAKLDFLSFESIKNEDSGSYVCTMIGHEDLPSSAVNLRVQRKHNNPVLSTRMPTKDITPTLTLSAKNTDQTFNTSQQPKNRGMFRISIIMLAGVCIGFITAIMVTVLLYNVKLKKKKKTRQCADSNNKPPDPNNDGYMTLHISSMSAEYDTLNAASETIYENLRLPGNSMT